MPPLYASRTRVDVQEVERLVELHLQYMRVTSHEKLWRTGKECGPNAGIVVARIATYMLDEHIYVLALKTVQLAIHQSEITPVAITAYSAEGTEGSQSLRHLYTSDVAGMPDLIAGFEVM